jgi:hypothetical protein
VLGSVFLGVAFLEGRLNGTAQDSKRPLRVFISTLLFRWSQCGFPLPMWISGADANDPGSKDQDNFCELVHLILDDMEVPTPEGQVQPRLTTGQIDAVLRALLAKKIRKKFRPSARIPAFEFSLGLAHDCSVARVGAHAVRSAYRCASELRIFKSMTT